MEKKDKDFKEAQSYLLSLVAKKEYTRQQLDQKLQKRCPEISSEKREEILDGAAQKQFFSDDRFAHIFVRQSLAKGDGPLKIKQKLWEKGISTVVSEQALLDEYPPELQQEMARKVWERKKTSGASKDKLMRYLLGKGFSSDIIYKIINH